MQTTTTLTDLESANYEAVSERMLTKPHSASFDSSAACRLNSTEDLSILWGSYGYDQTFNSQINSVYHNYAEIDSDLISPPDVYLVTAISAIPVADSVRGFYQEMGVDEPPIGIIKADRDSSELFFKSHNDELVAFMQYREEHKQYADAGLLIEGLKLDDLVRGVGHVCVIDQYVSSGRTLNYAAKILEQGFLKVGNMSAIRGDWYGDVSSEDVDFDNVTSSHRDFMQKIGRISVVS